MKLQQVLLGTTALLFLSPLFLQSLPAQALPTNRAMQIASDNCILYVSTSTKSYAITVCKKSDNNIEMVLNNRTTGEHLTLPATQVDNAGNVFRASFTKREKVTTRILVPQATTATTYLLDVTKQEFFITQETMSLGNLRKSIQVEKLGGILISSGQHYNMV
jgi:hypothetical protein